jgi:hypothetical protein
MGIPVVGISVRIPDSGVSCAHSCGNILEQGGSP